MSRKILQKFGLEKIITANILSLFFYTTNIYSEEATSIQNKNVKEENSPFFKGEWYFSWGYSRDYWQPSDIHITQPGLGNSFTLHKVKGDDYPEWSLYNIFAPQYNARIGHFLNDDKTIALELNIDHTKYNTTVGQTVRISGFINGQYIDTNQTLSEGYFKYVYHNGLNHIMLNIVKRFSIMGILNEDYNLTFLAKFGAGFLLPHSENIVLGKANDVGSKNWDNVIGLYSGWWQLGGWTTGAEAAFRFVVFKPFYLELSDKVAYANLSHIPVYQGTARQELWMNEVILSAGYTLVQ